VKKEVFFSALNLPLKLSKLKMKSEYHFAEMAAKFSNFSAHGLFSA
jgi:hypothetical protein